MQQTTCLILTTRKSGHYRPYGELFGILAKKEYAQVSIKDVDNVYEILKADQLILIDGDAHHLCLLPLIAVRSLFRKSTLLMSVRTEDLLNNRLKSCVKRMIFIFLKNLTKCKIISIHKSAQEFELKRYVNDFIFDIQFWDLPYLNANPVSPPELNINDLKANDNIVCVVLGGVNYKRNLQDIKNFIRENKNVNFVIAGKSETAATHELSAEKNAFFLNRYISDNELFYLFKECDCVYAYYTSGVWRPSGIFGRAVQFKKPVIINEEGYLNNYYSNYFGAIPVGRNKKIYENIKIAADRLVLFKSAFDSSAELNEHIKRD